MCDSISLGDEKCNLVNLVLSEPHFEVDSSLM